MNLASPLDNRFFAVMGGRVSIWAVILQVKKNRPRHPFLYHGCQKPWKAW